jgi:hypothetical protein
MNPTTTRKYKNESGTHLKRKVDKMKNEMNKKIPLEVIEFIEAIIAEVRMLDNAVEWRAACDEIMDRLRYNIKKG